ncbi:transcriptional regulator [Tenacibaculum singaporense]|uniref:Transcriptional regulator n=2 Tax=Tenacibaculum TaxID=104267 RepID=A0A3Q8RPH9_9FLAO|nr:transcriptional regulator [Tenacibaculum singaporense]AZJ36397.1 transcriptional regulator [Tenacibaculum singaporense]
MADINKIICNYISLHWMSKYKSVRAFALDHYIDEKTARKIKRKEGYRIPVSTLKKMCDAKEISLSNFFSIVEKD